MSGVCGYPAARVRVSRFLLVWYHSPVESYAGDTVCGVWCVRPHSFWRRSPRDRIKPSVECGSAVKLKVRVGFCPLPIRSALLQIQWRCSQSPPPTTPPPHTCTHALTRLSCSMPFVAAISPAFPTQTLRMRLSLGGWVGAYTGQAIRLVRLEHGRDTDR